jgi:hypothetical protein
MLTETVRRHSKVANSESENTVGKYELSISHNRIRNYDLNNEKDQDVDLNVMVNKLES